MIRKIFENKTRIKSQDQKITWPEKYSKYKNQKESETSQEQIHTQESVVRQPQEMKHQKQK